MKFFKKKYPWVKVGPNLSFLDPRKAKRCKDPMHSVIGNHDLCGMNLTPVQYIKNIISRRS